MELQDKARVVGLRWDYCAAGYDKIIEEERKTQEDCWLQLLMTLFGSHDRNGVA